VQSDPRLLGLLGYVQANPLRAGMVQRVPGIGNGRALAAAAAWTDSACNWTMAVRSAETSR
jgi:hypothetical protein